MKRVLILSVFAASALAASAQSRFDLNGDSEVNVGDVTKLVNIILGKEKDDSKPDDTTYSKYDLNRDGVVNVGDVTKVVNIVLIKEADDTDSAAMNGLCPDDHHPHRIDMGAAGVWACCNVGAKLPLDGGGNFAWGEKEEKETYYWEDYQYFDKQTGDVEPIAWDISASQYDVAMDMMRGEWVMPTADQLKRLFEMCTFEWVALGNMAGGKFTAPNGNAIFLPAAGNKFGKTPDNVGHEAYYWSSTYCATDVYKALGISFSTTLKHYNNQQFTRKDGMSVRAIRFEPPVIN